MVIYAEYLFLENVLIGAAILKLSSKLGRLDTDRVKLLLGSVLCGIFSFVIFLDNLGFALGNIIKLSFSFFLAFIVFGRSFLKGTLLIYIVSICMGGMTIALLYISQLRGITNNAVLYIGEPTYINVVVGVLATYLCLNGMSNILAQKHFRERVFVDVVLQWGQYKVEERALIDSGNFLKDPVLNLPVAVISKSEMEKIKGAASTDWQSRYCLIPYSTLGVERGLLEGYRMDQAWVNGENIGCIVVAVYESEFCSLGGEEHYQMLLNKDCLLGGAA